MNYTADIVETIEKLRKGVKYSYMIDEVSGYRAYTAQPFRIVATQVKRRWWLGFRTEYYISGVLTTFGPFDSRQEVEEIAARARADGVPIMPLDETVVSQLFSLGQAPLTEAADRW